MRSSYIIAQVHPSGVSTVMRGRPISVQQGECHAGRRASDSARLRNRRFFSLVELNRVVDELVADPPCASISGITLAVVREMIGAADSWQGG
jgi:hypothetical protein